MREARKLNIPVIALVDTNSDPNGIDYVLPGNDDALRSIRYFLSKSAQAISEGTTLRKEGGVEEVEAIMASGDKVAAEIMAAAKANEAAPEGGEEAE